MQIELPHLGPASQYSLLYSLNGLRELGPEARVQVSVEQGGVVLIEKTLHAGDADLYSQFRVPRAGSVLVKVKAEAADGSYQLQVNRWPITNSVKSAPIHDWEHALTVSLGKSVFAYGDDAEICPAARDAA